MLGATVLAWGGWALVIYRVDPVEAGLAAFVLFYATLLVALAGTLTILGLVYRVGLMKRRDVLSREVRIAVRHAILLSTVAVVTLALSAQGTLRWWSLLGLFVAAGIIEYLSLLIQESRRS